MSLAGCDGAVVVLQAAGPLAPVLSAIAERDPVDVLSRHADLDELFLDLYRDPATNAD